MTAERPSLCLVRRRPLTLMLGLTCGLLAATAASGCGDGADKPGADAGGGGPLYLVATAFEAGDQKETYLVTTRSFDANTTVNPTDGPKLLGGVVPLVRNGSVYAPDSNAPILVRYNVGPDDKLVKAGELSFMGVGLTELASWHIYAVSDTKGYVFDPSGSRIVVWNPSTMELTGQQIALSGIQRTGFTPNLVFEHSGPSRRGSQLLVPLSWTDQDGNSRFASGVVVLDVDRDQLVAIDEDERCGESYTTVAAPNGDVYFFPPDWSSTPHYFAEKHQPTCVLRVPSGAAAFDDAYKLDLSPLGSGSAAAGAVPDGQGGFFFTAVDPTLWADGMNEGKAVWRFYHHDLTTGQSRPVNSMPAWAGHCYYVNVGGDLFIPNWRETATGHRTTMYAVKGKGDPTELFSFDANWYGMGKLR